MGAAEYREITIEVPSSFVPGKVGIVTVTFNSEPVLQDFFASLDGQTYSNFLLIAVDNASADQTLALLEQHRSDRQFVLANAENLGIAEANNQGICAAIEAGCEFVMLLNNDVTLDPEMLSKLVEGLDSYNCQMTVPLMYFHEPANRIWAAGGGFHKALGMRVYHRHAHEAETPQSTTPKRIDYAPTCCVLARREIFAHVGLMDPRYFVYYDDVDFMFRARQADIHMFFVPGAKLWHKANALTGGAESDFTYYYGARGRSLFLYKHLGRFSAFVFFSLHVALDLSRAVFRKTFRHPCKLKWKGMREGRRVALNS
ncbi:MAG TPA: glycosyltransferase family 2 protein [Silvibacterium sp.]|nr:glycosyltransferase family 2 protein [Silvibacterium sp.]